MKSFMSSGPHDLAQLLDQALLTPWALGFLGCGGVIDHAIDLIDAGAHAHLHGVSDKLPLLKDLSLILGHLLTTAGNLDGLALLHTTHVDLVMLP